MTFLLTRRFRITIWLFAAAVAISGCDREDAKQSDSTDTAEQQTSSDEESQPPSEQDHPEPPRPVPYTGDATLVGKNVCLQCRLEKAGSLEKTLDDREPKYGLLVEYARNSKGQRLQEVIGRVVHYVPNDRSAQLLEGNKYDGERVAVSGWYMGSDATVEVIDFRQPGGDLKFLSEKKDIESPFKASPVDVTLRGSNVCLGCLLGKEQGVVQNCEERGNCSGFRVDKVVKPKDPEFSNIKGSSLYYYPDPSSLSFADSEQRRGEYYEIEGQLFRDARLLKVEDFSELEKPDKDNESGEKKDKDE